MDVERSMLSSAISHDGGVLELISRGITPELFSGTPAGQQCAHVFRFCVDYTRQYGQQPSLGAIQRRFPDWHAEFSPDPIPALADEFLDCVRKRYFDSIVVRLSKDYNQADQRRELDTVLLDAAREMAAVIPSGRVARFAAEMESRIAQYEVEANQGYRPAYTLGIPIIDEVMGGVRPGWLITFAGFSGLGKALDVYTPILTTEGWKAILDVQDGDVVYGSDGQQVSVLKAWPIMIGRPCLRITFSDGAQIVCDDDHLWRTYRWNARGSEVRALARVGARTGLNDQRHKRSSPSVVTAAQIMQEMQDEPRPHSIPCAAPLENSPSELPIDPYLLGYWLGDGGSDSATLYCSGDDLDSLTQQIDFIGERWSKKFHKTCWNVRFGHLPKDECRRGHRRPYRTQCPECGSQHRRGQLTPFIHTTAQERLRNLGVLGRKHIPELYMRASLWQRLALLQGIVDSDGEVLTTGRCQISGQNKALMEQVLELCLGMGFRATMVSRVAKINGIPKGIVYKVGFVTHTPIARLPRKASRLPSKPSHMSTHRYITSIERVNTRPVRCLTVASDDSLFLIGKELIPTHNTTLGLLGSLNVFEQDHSALFLSLEMSSQEVMERLDTMINNFPHRDLARRQLADTHVDRWRDLTRIYKRAAGEIVVVDRLGGATLDRIHAEIARYRPSVAVIDYVQRMSGTRHSMAKWEGLEEITNGLKTIAMDTDTAIIMVSQDGRTSAEEGSTRTNAGGSISVYQAADAYIGMFQSDEMHGMGKMRVRLLKFRHGPRAEVDMSWAPATGEYGKWEDPMQFHKAPILTP